MIYSGVDLIRKSDQQAARAEKLTAPKAVAAIDTSPNAGKDPDPQGALLRFARFINKEKSKKSVSKPSKQPYLAAKARQQQVSDIGQMLDIYA